MNLQQATSMPRPSLIVPIEERLRRLYSLDLSDIRIKLKESAPEGLGWSDTQCDEAELWYRRFLHAVIVHEDADRPLVPNGTIDSFWHHHILDTRAYVRDTTYVLGYYLHHYPYFGMKGDSDERDSCFDHTNAVYRELFGVDCTGTGRRGAHCGGSCKTSMVTSH